MQMEQLNQRLSESFSNDRTDWGVALWSGLLAGIVFIVAEMLLFKLILGLSPWTFLNLTAAIFLGKGVFPFSEQFNFTILLAAIALHIPLSATYGFIFCWITHKVRGILVVFLGLSFGAIIYAINFFIIAPTIFPWFVEVQNKINFFSHLLFGTLLGAIYAMLRNHQIPNR